MSFDIIIGLDEFGLMLPMRSAYGPALAENDALNPLPSGHRMFGFRTGT